MQFQFSVEKSKIEFIMKSICMEFWGEKCVKEMLNECFKVINNSIIKCIADPQCYISMDLFQSKDNGVQCWFLI